MRDLRVPHRCRRPHTRGQGVARNDAARPSRRLRPVPIEHLGDRAGKARPAAVHLLADQGSFGGLCGRPGGRPAPLAQDRFPSGRRRTSNRCVACSFCEVGFRVPRWICPRSRDAEYPVDASSCVGCPRPRFKSETDSCEHRALRFASRRPLLAPRVVSKMLSGDVNRTSVESIISQPSLRLDRYRRPLFSIKQTYRDADASPTIGGRVAEQADNIAESERALGELISTSCSSDPPIFDTYPLRDR